VVPCSATESLDHDLRRIADSAPDSEIDVIVQYRNDASFESVERIWSSNVIWGPNVVGSSNVIWRTNVIWGSSIELAAQASTLPIHGEK
jgi:hypothetical protein